MIKLYPGDEEGFMAYLDQALQNCLWSYYVKRVASFRLSIEQVSKIWQYLKAGCLDVSVIASGLKIHEDEVRLAMRIYFPAKSVRKGDTETERKSMEFLDCVNGCEKLVDGTYARRLQRYLNLELLMAFYLGAGDDREICIQSLCQVPQEEIAKRLAALGYYERPPSKTTVSNRRKKVWKTMQWNDEEHWINTDRYIDKGKRKVRQRRRRQRKKKKANGQAA